MCKGICMDVSDSDAFYNNKDSIVYSFKTK